MSLDLYLGPMFAGKSSAILGVVRRNEIIGRKTLCLTSALDTRYSTEARIVSHNKESYPAVAISTLMPVICMHSFNSAECIVIEEAQFFPDLRDFALAAVEGCGKHVICVGLDGDSERRPFGQLLDLIPFADNVRKFKALCTHCRNGTEAIFTLRKSGASGSQIAVGGQDTYEPLCRRHYMEGHREAKLAEFITNHGKETSPEAIPPDLLSRCISSFGDVEGHNIYTHLIAENGGGPSLR
jgi:thymidine kinase